jgi:hypothetical protein
MQKETIDNIITKYRALADSTDDGEKADKYSRFVWFIEENIELFEEDESYETEDDLLDYFKEVELEPDAQRDAMFSEGDDDDSITDFMTR